MTKEQLRQTGEAMIAFADGKPVQCCYGGEWSDANEPAWNPNYLYRKKPDPKTRQWSKPGDVPGPVCWIRSGSDQARMIISLTDSGIRVACINAFGESCWFHWSETSSFEYSTDRKTWHKCEVTECT